MAGEHRIVREILISDLSLLGRFQAIENGIDQFAIVIRRGIIGYPK